MINDFDAVTNQIRDDILEWLKKYQLDSKLTERRAESGGVLSGEALEDFIGALQDKIVESVTKYAGGFGENTVGDNATLILYSGVNPQMVEDFCNQSGGKYYMISQTGADVLWNKRLRGAIAEAIGESKPTYPVSARVLEGKQGKCDLKDGERLYRLEVDAKYATDSHRLLALDDFISQKVAEAGVEKGKIHYFLANSHSGIPRSVGLLTEIPHALNLMWSQGIDAEKNFQLGTGLTRIGGKYQHELIDASDALLYVAANQRIVYADMLQCLGASAPPPPKHTYAIVTTFQQYAKEMRAKMHHLKSIVESRVLPQRAKKDLVTPEMEIVMRSHRGEQDIYNLHEHEAQRIEPDEPTIDAHINPNTGIGLNMSMEDWQNEIRAARHGFDEVPNQLPDISDDFDR